MTIETRRGRTQVSNEAALIQSESADERVVVSIVLTGVHLRGGYRFVVERVERAEETESLAAYEFWTETQRSGLYETLRHAQQAVEVEAPGPFQWRAYGSIAT